MLEVDLYLEKSNTIDFKVSYLNGVSVTLDVNHQNFVSIDRLMLTNLSNDQMVIAEKQALFSMEFLHKKTLLPVGVNKYNVVSEEKGKP